MSNNTELNGAIPEIKVEALNVLSAVGTASHDELIGRDAENQHPISAIIGLQTALNTKADIHDLELKADASTIPTKTSDLTNDSNFITLVHAHNAQNLNAINYSDIADTPVIPTKLSDLQNDTGFVNNTSEQKFITVTADSVVFEYGTAIYKKTIAAQTALTFDTTALTHTNSVATFELWLEVQATSLTISFPSLTWVGDTPDFSAAGVYVVTLRYDGSSVIANLAYKLELASEEPGGSESGNTDGPGGSGSGDTGGSGSL